MKNRQLWGCALLAATAIFALAPIYRHGDISVPLHHLFHVCILVGAAVSALLLTVPTRAPLRRNASWLVLAIVAPLLAMFLMWPSEYSVFERSPMLHVAEHLCLLGCGFVTAYAGQRYAPGIGIVMSASLWLMGVLAIGGYGVSPPSQVALVAVAPTSTRATSPANAAHGATIFQQNCSACHGIHGQGGVGPMLIGENSRKDFAETVRWIENPAPPMPKLYPDTLSAQDVQDVAAYVGSLK